MDEISPPQKQPHRYPCGIQGAISQLASGIHAPADQHGITHLGISWGEQPLG